MKCLSRGGQIAEPLVVECPPLFTDEILRQIEETYHWLEEILRPNRASGKSYKAKEEK